MAERGMQQENEVDQEPIVTAGNIRDASEPNAYWSVPVLAPEAVQSAARKLAAKPVLDGKWRRGTAAAEEWSVLGIREEDWTSGCGCGRLQPCRHAQSLLFRFRRAATRKPQLRWAAAGVDPQAFDTAIRTQRAALARSATKSASAAAWEARASALAASVAVGSRLPWIVKEAEDPLFWNRDVSFAEWLRPIALAAREGGEAKHDA